jgi:hypothetical protein
VPVKLELKNLYAGSAGLQDSMTIILPEGVKYIANSVNFRLNSFTQTTPIIKTGKGFMVPGTPALQPQPFVQL